MCFEALTETKKQPQDIGTMYNSVTKDTQLGVLANIESNLILMCMHKLPKTMSCTFYFSAPIYWFKLPAVCCCLCFGLALNSKIFS